MQAETPPFRVRYAETDAQAVAYYASYFVWWEVGDIHLLESAGILLPDLDRQGLLFSAVESYGRFIRPAVYDDLVSVRVRLAQAAPKRVLFETALLRVGDGATLATGKMAYVLVGPGGKALPIPEHFAAMADERVERIVVSDKADLLLGPNPPGVREHTQDIKVRYAETDSQGVAYYGSYYAWFEAGRNELTRSVGLPYSTLERQGIYLPVSEAFCRHYSPLRASETFRMATSVPVLGRARMTFVNRIASCGRDVPIPRNNSAHSSADGQRQIAAGYTVHACTGRDGRPRGLAPEIVERFAPKPPEGA